MATNNPANAISLARLFDLGDDARTDWLPDDLAAIWRHQLDAPLRLDLPAANPTATATINTLDAAPQKLPATFQQLFAHPHPPLELLELAKDFGKLHRQDPTLVPAGVATVIYFACIGLALWRCGTRITQLDDSAIQRGLTWCIAQPWLDDATRALLQKNLRHL